MLALLGIPCMVLVMMVPVPSFQPPAPAKTFLSVAENKRWQGADARGRMRGQGWVENKSWGCTKDLPNSGGDGDGDGHGGAEGNDGDRDGMVMGTSMVMMVAIEGTTVMKLEMVVNINVLKPAVSQMPQSHETSSQRRSPEALPCTLNCKPRP